MDESPKMKTSVNICHAVFSLLDLTLDAGNDRLLQNDIIEFPFYSA
jgi:hypothetical protein